MPLAKCQALGQAGRVRMSCANAQPMVILLQEERVLQQQRHEQQQAQHVQVHLEHT